MVLYTVPVGNRATWEPTCCLGPMLEYVVEGSLSVIARAPIDVVRADGTVETTGAGVEATLAAGDAFLSDNETPLELWNSGETPVVLLDWVFIDIDTGFLGHDLDGWTGGLPDIRDVGGLPYGAATATLLRVTVAGGGETTLEDPGGLLFVANESDERGYSTRHGDGSITLSAGPESPFVAYVLRLEPDTTKETPAAAVASPAPDEPLIETVFTMPLAAEEMPTGYGSSGLALYSVPVGHRTTWEPSCCPGPLIEYVVEGSYGARAEAPLRVVRSTGETDEIAAGTEVMLGPGDTLISRNETVAEIWNAGETPVVLLDWWYLEGDVGHEVSGWTLLTYQVGQVTLPLAPVTMTLMRVTLVDGAETTLVPADPNSIQYALQLEQRRGKITRNPNHSITITANPGETYVVYALTVDSDATGGTPASGSPEAGNSP
jgi:hypothetical protein